MAIPESNNPKSQLRKAMRLIPLEPPADSAATIRALERWLAEHPGLQTIATYCALPGEVDLAELTTAHPQRRWVYPRVHGTNLTFHLVENPAVDLTPGAFRIFEPSPALAEIPIEMIDAFLCPGLAFDPHGGRLGRGKGFYDRMLAMARPDALKIGVCEAARMVPDTFPESHDVRMDEVVSG